MTILLSSPLSLSSRAFSLGRAIFRASLFTLLLSSCKETEHTNSTSLDESLLNVVFETVRESYVEPVDNTKLVEGALSGALSSLDPFSAYLSEGHLRYLEELTKGEFGGIGVEILFQDNGLLVVSPIDDSPAQKAGILAGDLITHVNGEKIEDWSPLMVLEKLHGAPGTELTLTLQRKKKKLTVALSREMIAFNPVKSGMKGAIGYLRISCFHDNTVQQLREAVAHLFEQSPQGSLKGVVLDLRNNPGGTLEQAIGVSSLFLEKGLPIVTIRKRNERENQTHYAQERDLLKNIPLAILINKGSASASEIVASALHDHKRAVLVGTKSFGKGSAQVLLPIKSRGENKGAIKLTIALFSSPSGKVIQQKGVEPDIFVASPEGEELHPQERRTADSSEKLKPPHNRKKDQQLQRALDTLKAVSIFDPKKNEKT